MANTTLTFGTVAEKYVLLAILAGAIAGVSAFAGFPAIISQAAIITALIAGLSAAFSQYASTGSIPGTQIPIATLFQLGLGALIAVIEKFGSQTSWTTPTILAAVVLFLGTLLSEVQAQPSTPTANSGSTSTVAGPPS